jgi:glycine/D-amino acid oxidase-like deaminating enzyme
MVTTNGRQYGIAIVGAGVTGLFAAYEALLRGQSVALIDAHANPGGGTTLTSGGSIGLLDKLTSQSQALAMESIEQYRSLQSQLQRGRKRCIHWCGALVPFWNARDKATCQVVAEQVAALGVRVEELSAAGVAALAPALSKQIKGGYYCDGDGRIDPPQFASSMLGYLKTRWRDELTWLPNTRVTGLERKGDAYVVQSVARNERLELRAAATVLATGSYHNESNWPITRDIRPRRGVVMQYDRLCDMDVVILSSAYLAQKAAGSLDSCVAFTFEQRDGLWRVGSSRELVGRLDLRIDRVAERIRREAIKHIPELRSAVVRSAIVCFRPFEPELSAHVVPGNSPFERVISINGQEGDGVCFAPVLARQAVEELVG